jgi:hypothetical protein
MVEDGRSRQFTWPHRLPVGWQWADSAGESAEVYKIQVVLFRYINSTYQLERRRYLDDVDVTYYIIK